MPDRPVFLDTNGWIALLNSSDALHAAASSVWSDLLREHRINEVVTTDRHFEQAGFKCLLPLA